MKTESIPSLQNVEERKRAVGWVLRFVENTTLDPSSYERDLLDCFVEGSLSLDEVLDRLEQPAKLR